MSDTTRIAKNSIYLYARMLLMTGISLYTSRVILANLGVEDFGIFGAVGGIAIIFSFFNNALISSTQRFITVSIGKDTLEDSQKVFSMSMKCHLIVAVVILLLSETVGLWFLNHKMNIPLVRMNEANWVFQFALFSCLIGVLTVPFTGCIVAYEKMSFFAAVSIVQAILKLCIAWILAFYAGDRLVLYSFLLLCVSVITASINFSYCKLNFHICRFVVSRSKVLFRSMMSFTGWNLFKMGAVMGVAQGNNIIVNIFGGPVASAAMSIANQVNGAVYSFMQNVQTAFKPQITKTFASGNREENIKLTNFSAKISFMLLCLAGLPLMLQMTPILRLWLTEVPASTSTLCVFSIISVAFDALAGPLATTVHAKGNIKRYQIFTSILWAISIPAAWILMKTGVEFKYILISKILAQSCVLIYSLNYLQKEIDFPVREFLINQLLRPFAVVAMVVVIGFLFINSLSFKAVINIFLTITYTTVFQLIGFYFFALKQNERESIKALILKKLVINHKKR